MVNGPQLIFVERFGRIFQVDSAFVDEAHLRRVIDRIVSRVGRRVDESQPDGGRRLPDGSRVNAVLPPVALDGSLLTIRKFAADPLTVDDLIRFRDDDQATGPAARGLRPRPTRHADQRRYRIRKDHDLERAVQLRASAGTSDHDRDSAELQLRQRHVLRMESRPPNIEQRGEVTIRDLVRNALRMRPDRIIIGESATARPSTCCNA